MKKRQTNLFLIVFVILLFVQCNSRTPNNIRFSKICDIEIPQNIEIIKDEYQNFGLFYANSYDIKLTKESQEKLTESIRKSKFYNPNINIKNGISDDLFLDIDGLRAFWANTENGYTFLSDFKIKPHYVVVIDTILEIAKFGEMSE